MSQTLKLATTGDWKAHDAHVVSDAGVIVTTADTRYHPNPCDRIREREANARIMAVGKRMYRLILELQYKPMNQLVPEIRSIIQDVDQPTNEEFTYEHP